MTYTPKTKEELEELEKMGFHDWSETGNYKMYNEETGMIFFYANWSINPWQFFIPRNWVIANWYTFYPRSKEHLEQIILAFTK